MAPNWALLGDLAQRIAGEPVTVAELDAEHAEVCDGLATWSGAKYVVYIAPHLEPGDLLAVFLHELAHIILKHVSKTAPSLDSTTWHPTLQLAVANLHKVKEAAADDWAAAVLKSLAPDLRRQLVALLCAAGGAEARAR